jgi:hypothetical protein
VGLGAPRHCEKSSHCLLQQKKNVKKNFTKSENTVEMTFLRDIVENLACRHEVRPVFSPDG